MSIQEQEINKHSLTIHKCLQTIEADDDDNIDVISEWFDAIGKENNGAKEKTQLSYIRTLIEFCKIINKTPYEIIEEAKVEKKKIIDIDDRAVKKYFVKYKRVIIEKNNAPKTISRKIATIKSFFEVRNIDVPIRQTKSRSSTPKKENKHIPTREDIKEALHFANIRNKAIILLQASSGLSSIDVRNIPVRTINEGLNQEDNIITFDMRRIKTDVDFITFCSPEATEAIKAYMEYRNRPPFANTQEKKDQYEKRRIRSDDDFLFINSKISDEYLVNFDENYRFISDQEIQHAYRLIERSCENKAPKGTHSFIRSHNMRKFFASTIRNHGLEFTTIETFLGHKVKGSLDNYTEADIKILKEQYMKVLPHLMILEDLEVKTLETYDYRLNSANIEIMNIQNTAMMELYPLKYEIMEQSKTIVAKYDTIIKLKKMDNKKLTNKIKSLFDEIKALKADRSQEEFELNQYITSYQKDIDNINKKYKVNIPATLDQLVYDWKPDEELKEKELNF
ncbi:MAG TPA: tyrosine-type recombinase/integrase [Methanosarcina sp.]|nr:tyrosine-type recombinase/integrase [Methanosarcina sp.]